MAIKKLYWDNRLNVNGRKSAIDLDNSLLLNDWVDQILNQYGLISAGAGLGADNGLTKDGSTIELGGNLTKATTIDAASFDLTVNSLGTFRTETADGVFIELSDVACVQAQETKFMNDLGVTVVAVQSNTLKFGEIPAYADDSAAASAGLTAGQMYITNGSGAAPLNVAGILMVKQ